MREGVRVLCEAINALCTDLGLDQIWLHFEGRSTQDGRTELIEINPRPGGGQIPTAIQEINGIDVIEANVSMALGGYAPEDLGPLREQPIIGWSGRGGLKSSARSRSSPPRRNCSPCPASSTCKLSDGYQITNLRQENFFFSFTMTADSVDQLRAHAAKALDTLDYRVRP